LDPVNIEFTLEWEGGSRPKEIEVSIKTGTIEIGKMSLKDSKGWMYELKNISDQVILYGTPQKKRWSTIREKYEIRDATKTLIGISIISITGYETKLENEDGEMLLLAWGTGPDKGYVIVEDVNKNQIAKGDFSQQKVKRSFWHRDYYNKLQVQVLKQDFDKKLFWAILCDYLGVLYRYDESLE